MTIPARKLSFQEAWESITVFFVDEDLEQEIDQQVEILLRAADRYGTNQMSELSAPALGSLLREDMALEVILHEVELSQEKFLRVISLLRRIGRIQETLDVEWSMKQVVRRIQGDPDFASLVAHVLLDGCRDTELQALIPRYYLETLNLREIASDSRVARRVRYKRALIGTYSGRKGYRVEARIADCLSSICQKHGIGYEQGRSRFIETDIDFAIPSLEDPWVVLMSSFQETTSSGQSTKARDMLAAYERMHRSNARYGENRAFVNFVDGGGWLARKRDFQRLVENCHYFINLAWLGMLPSIVLAHVPAAYRSRGRSA
jgi:hypothetical protein